VLEGLKGKLMTMIYTDCQISQTNQWRDQLLSHAAKVFEVAYKTLFQRSKCLVS